MRKYLIVVLLLFSVFSVYSIQIENKNNGKQITKDSIAKTTTKTNKEPISGPVKSKKFFTQKKQKEKFSSKNIIVYSGLFILGVLLTLIFNWLMNKIKAENHKDEIKKLHKKIEVLEWELANSKDNKGNDSKLLLDKKIDLPNTETKKRDEELSLGKEWKVKNDLPAVTNERIIYFPNPNMEGNFKQNEGNENFIEGASIYKFTLKSETTALVEICDENSSIAMVKNNRNDLILNIAIETNPYNPNATQIQIVGNMKAKAQLEGNIWVIKEKAKIKYV